MMMLLIERSECDDDVAQRFVGDDDVVDQSVAAAEIEDEDYTSKMMKKFPMIYRCITLMMLKMLSLFLLLLLMLFLKNTLLVKGEC